jgi:hypothetical protein
MWKWLWTTLKSYPEIFLEELKNTTKKSVIIARLSDQILNQGPPKHEAETLTLLTTTFKKLGNLYFEIMENI